MIMANKLLETLLKEDTVTDYQNCNDDYDFGEVLKFCCTDKSKTNMIRYADGEEKPFSFIEKV